MKKEKFYLVIELKHNEVPRIVGMYRNRADAEKVAYAPGMGWCNIKEISPQ